MPIKFLAPPQYKPNNPFTIAKWTGSNPNNENLYYVTFGSVFSNFSYNTGSFIGINALGNTPFKFEKNYKFYLEFKISTNLQVTSANLRCSEVSTEDLTKIKDLYPLKWPSYPSMVHIEPQDEYDEKGRIKILKNGKKQGMCYALIGYRSDDEYPNGKKDVAPPESIRKTTNGFYPIQCLNSDIMLVNVAMNGVPAVVPMPYFNGTNHYIYNGGF